MQCQFVQTVPQLTLHALSENVEYELDTLSNLSFLSSSAPLDIWLFKLERAATFVQAVWRGYFLRRTFHAALEQKAALTIQRVVRGVEGRSRADELFLWAMAVRIQCMYRMHMAQVEYDNLRFEAQWATIDMNGSA